jgi:hypothetical protein
MSSFFSRTITASDFLLAKKPFFVLIPSDGSQLNFQLRNPIAVSIPGLRSFAGIR